MKIALIGYGKMGKEIEKIALSRSHTIGAILDENNTWENNVEQLKQCDVAIEFSTPHTVLENIQKCFAINLPVVVGATGWYDHLEEIEKQCIEQDKTLFWSSNFSIGVNIFFELNRQLAHLMNKYDFYDVEMTEIHHTQKLDQPSGTAITLANDIIKNLDRKNIWASQEKEKHDDLLINSVREDSVPGIHTISYSCDIDSIEITHEAKSRKGFATGAVSAAEFLAGKKGLFKMKDLLGF